MDTKFKVLLATDYSEAVMNAERYAVQFAKLTNSTLTLLHVYKVPIPKPVEATVFSEEASDFGKSELQRLIQHKDKLLNSLKIRPDELMVDCMVREGEAGKQIREVAKESDSNFIIVGTHGASGFRETMYGSHSWNVIKKSSIPVLAIPKDALFTGIKNIVFATEYREGEIPLINFIARFANTFDAKVTVLHVTNYVLSKTYEAKMFKKFREDIFGKVSYPKLSMRLIRNENIAEGINNYCLENKVDMVVMAPEKPFLLEKIFFPASMTKKMSFRTKIPLMAVPDFYNSEFSKFWKNYIQGDLVNQGV